MFHVGDYIVYGSNGICRVEEITHPDIAGIDEDKLYYVLVPEKTRDSRLFCPTDNSRVVLRSVITADEAAALMEEVKEIEPLQVESERMRDDSYKKAMKIRKEERESHGKKVTVTDERYMKLAEEGLYSELSLVMGKDREEIKEKFLDYCKQ